MKKQNKAVWVGVEQLTNDPSFLEAAQQEFYELPIVDQLSEEKTLDASANRRDFLKYCTASAAALGLGSLEILLNRGQRYDWFESQRIQILALLTAGSPTTNAPGSTRSARSR